MANPDDVITATRDGRERPIYVKDAQRYADTGWTVPGYTPTAAKTPAEEEPELRDNDDDDEE